MKRVWRMFVQWFRPANISHAMAANDQPKSWRLADQVAQRRAKHELAEIRDRLAPLEAEAHLLSPNICEEGS